MAQLRRADLFPTEAHFLQFLAELLARLPSIAYVRIIHGIGETGKDIIFQVKGAFGEDLHCAAIAINKRITGSVASNRGARELLFAAEQSLDKPVSGPGGEAIRIEKVYIMSSTQIS